jgi:hypothetical protein
MRAPCAKQVGYRVVALAALEVDKGFGAASQGRIVYLVHVAILELQRLVRLLLHPLGELGALSSALVEGVKVRRAEVETEEGRRRGGDAAGRRPLALQRGSDSTMHCSTQGRNEHSARSAQRSAMVSKWMAEHEHSRAAVSNLYTT